MQRYRAIPAGYEDDEDFLVNELPKVTIIRERITAGAGIGGIDFNSDLGNLGMWFKDYIITYNTYKRTPSTEQQLRFVLIEDVNPLLLSLKLFAASPGCNNLKNKNLALLVLEIACDLAAKNHIVTEICDENTRMVAFNFIKTCGINSIYKAVIKAYGLKSIRHHLLPKLQEMLKQGLYKDVAYWAMFLEMTDSFGIFEIIFPLMLQDKTFLAEEYLDIAHNLQLPTVQFLDSLLDKRKTVYEHCDKILAEYAYLNIRHGLLLHKPILKLVTRLAKKYKISDEHTPNLMFSKSCSYLRYLFYKYREGGMNLEAWRELIPELAASKEIQIELIKTLANHSELEEAAHWLKQFKLPASDLSDDMRSLLNYVEVKAQKSTEQQEEITDINWSSNYEDDFLKLCLSKAQIILIDDKEKFDRMLKFLKAQQLIAFDSEWKPSVSSDNVISLLQLATTDRVYLVDCLSTNLTPDNWKSFGREIFNNLEILKIGFAIDHDLRMLHKSLPIQMSLQNGRPCLLDLRELWRRLKFMEIINLPYANGLEIGEGLSALTEACFGKKLDKSNQCSNWANRPLRPDQITYAALDAHCLLQIYQIFADHLHRVGLDIDKVVEEITTGKTGYLFHMKTTLMFNSDVPSSSSNNGKVNQIVTSGTISAAEIGFVCDMDLKGLSKELRKLGISCLHIKKSDFSQYLTQLNREKCFVLTKQPQRHSSLLKEIGRDKFVRIFPANAADQTVFVLNHFKIQVQERHMYTRCIECNSNEFILAFKEQIEKMRNGTEEDYANEYQNMKTSNVIKHDRDFLLLNTNEHILKTKTTYRGQAIRLQLIKDHHLTRAEQFFICDSCGYVSWSGAHPVHQYIAKVIGCDAQSFPCV